MIVRFVTLRSAARAVDSLEATETEKQEQWVVCDCNEKPMETTTFPSSEDLTL